eukprot:TRINITY_DN13457_c0_g2_i1.p1 TRINITY_DN13457_c0_g2~~TRINITY_DN13457_c0_g2_i1.p1  ORF type:complete len:145 (+),score=32.28 TRINITY_DN13457_c0_g2_i1:74-508(+)
MIRRPPRSTLSSSSAASDVYKRQELEYLTRKVEQAKAEMIKQFEQWYESGGAQVEQYAPQIEEHTMSAPSPPVSGGKFAQDSSGQAYHAAKQRASQKALDTSIMKTSNLAMLSKQAQPFGKQIDKSSTVLDQGKFGARLGGWNR